VQTVSADFPPHLLAGKVREKQFVDQLLDPSQIPKVELPFEARLPLRPYQRDGVSWLRFLCRYNLNGALCDGLKGGGSWQLRNCFWIFFTPPPSDMGLGKTLQTICALAMVVVERRADGAPPLPSLIVCPSTLCSHWRLEVEKVVGGVISIIVLGGTPAERAKYLILFYFDKLPFI
jgi:TATA-binding protein-associated factor